MDLHKKQLGKLSKNPKYFVTISVMVLAYHYYNRNVRTIIVIIILKYTHTHNSLNNSWFSTVRPVWARRYSSPLNALIVVLEVVQFFSTRWLCDFRLTPHEGRGLTAMQCLLFFYLANSLQNDIEYLSLLKFQNFVTFSTLHLPWILAQNSLAK